MGTLILDTTDTESAEFVPGGFWAIGVDTYSSDVEVEWKSPEDTWVNLFTMDSVGLQVARGMPNETYRLTTATAGSRAFLIVD